MDGRRRVSDSSIRPTPTTADSSQHRRSTFIVVECGRGGGGRDGGSALSSSSRSRRRVNSECATYKPDGVVLSVSASEAAAAAAACQQLTAKMKRQSLSDRRGFSEEGKESGWTQPLQPVNEVRRNSSSADYKASQITHRLSHPPDRISSSVWNSPIVATATRDSHQRPNQFIPSEISRYRNRRHSYGSRIDAGVAHHQVPQSQQQSITAVDRPERQGSFVGIQPPNSPSNSNTMHVIPKQRRYSMYDRPPTPSHINGSQSHAGISRSSTANAGRRRMSDTRVMTSSPSAGAELFRERSLSDCNRAARARVLARLVLKSPAAEASAWTGGSETGGGSCSVQQRGHSKIPLPRRLKPLQVHFDKADEWRHGSESESLEGTVGSSSPAAMDDVSDDAESRSNSHEADRTDAVRSRSSDVDEISAERIPPADNDFVEIITSPVNTLEGCKPRPFVARRAKGLMLFEGNGVF